MGLFSNLFSNDVNKRNESFGLLQYLKEKEKKQEEDELDNYNLEEWQKELVKDNKYNPCDFEEEELEDDDYYEEED